MLIATEDEKFLLFYSARDKSFVPGDLANIQSHDTRYITQKFILFQGFFHPNDQMQANVTIISDLITVYKSIGMWFWNKNIIQTKNLKQSKFGKKCFNEKCYIFLTTQQFAHLPNFRIRAFYIWTDSEV